MGCLEDVCVQVCGVTGEGSVKGGEDVHRLCGMYRVSVQCVDGGRKGE